MNQVVTAILGGGQGQRLWPLTRDRAKPAVPLGGKFRLIDVPHRNCASIATVLSSSLMTEYLICLMVQKHLKKHSICRIRFFMNQ